MKKAALLSGPLVVPSSATAGTPAGIGVGSLYGVAASEGSWYVDIKTGLVAQDTRMR
jgi:hypothetical protein